MKTSRSSIQGFQKQYTRTLIFSFQINEESVLDHIAPIYFHVYSVVLVLRACVNECTIMIGLTRLDSSFPDTLEVCG
jgi:hypothetical protein